MGLIKSIYQLSDSRVQKIVFRAGLVSVLVFFITVIGINLLLEAISITGINWIDSSITILGTSGAFLLGLFIFPSLAGLIISFYLNQVASAVEAQHYPHLGDVRDEALSEIVSYALRFTFISVSLNLVLLVIIVPSMLMTVVLAPLIPFVFLLVNGYLIGREYFELVAVRRLEPPAARALRIRYKKRIWGYGIVVSILMMIPLINWLMPIIAAAYMVHNFERVRTGADDQ
ncbi:MAG: EI24 domain-containing protein [Pseudomonadota bacterium]|nr:EI24 domain-containing protein [Pseudomonadota bacterium]